MSAIRCSVTATFIRAGTATVKYATTAPTRTAMTRSKMTASTLIRYPNVRRRQAMLSVEGHAGMVPLAPSYASIALRPFTFGHVLIVNAKRSRQGHAPSDRIRCDKTRPAERQRDADSYPFARYRWVVDPSACDWVSLAKSNRGLEDALIESWILSIALTTPAALDTCAASINVFSEVKPTTACMVSQIRASDRVSAGVLQRNRFAAAYKLGGANHVS